MFFILFVPLTFLLWHGETAINKRAVVGYSVFSFLNSKESIKKGDLSALKINIENSEEENIEYLVSISVNDRQIDFQEILVAARSNFIIEPSEKIIEEASQNASNKYTVSFQWGEEKDKKGALKKQFELSNEK